MVLSPVRRAAPCPRADCPEWAFFAFPFEIGHDAHIWSCPRGHHGPRVVGFEHAMR